MRIGCSVLLAMGAMLASAPATAQNTEPQPTAADTSAWSALADLHPGTEVVMKVGRASYGLRYLVGTSDTDVTVLNLRDPWLPPAARETLRHLATYEPAYLLESGAKEFAHRDVRVRSGAVFQAGEKLIDLSRVIERFPRDEVKEIKRAPRRTTGQALGMLAGGLTGAIAAGVFGYREFQHHKPAGALLVGFSGTFIGTGLGQLIGSLFDPQPKAPIYRAP